MMDNLGVSMNATTLQAYALEKGINFKWKTASNAQKAELAMKMFMDRTKQYQGNFARESSETFSGSLGAVKAAAENLFASMAIGENISPKLEALKTTIRDFIFNNLLPMVGQILEKVPELVEEVIKIALESITRLGNTLAEKFPEFEGVFKNLDAIVIGLVGSFVAYKAAIAISGIVTALINATKGQTLAQAALNMVMNANPFVLIATLLGGLVTATLYLWNTNEGFRNAVSNIFNSIWNVIKGVVGFIVDYWTKVIPGAFNTAVSFIYSIPGKIGGALGQLPNIFWNISRSAFDAMRNGLSGVADIGSNLVRGIWDGMSNVTGWIIGKIRGFTTSVLNSIKSFFGIHSPSRAMADEVGHYLPEGLAVGVLNNMEPVTYAMEEMKDTAIGDIKGSFEYDINNRNNLSKNRQPLYISFTLGNHEYKAFVEDITEEQNKKVAMELSY